MRPVVPVPPNSDAEALYEPDRHMSDEKTQAIEATVVRYNLINAFLNQYKTS